MRSNTIPALVDDVVLVLLSVLVVEILLVAGLVLFAVAELFICGGDDDEDVVVEVEDAIVTEAIWTGLSPLLGDEPKYHQ